MAASMRHRGPDACGTFVENGVGIGMRRLSIIDLSPLGHQPMANEDGQVQVVYNGEIYNFLDLRRDLVANGHNFRSATDTEVLVHGYEQYGACELAKRLEGMYAFAVLDRRVRKLTLVRGPFGIKPLYLRRGPGQLSFASEIRALAQDGLGRPAVATSFVESYLSLGYVPSPRTAFRDVVKLPGATALEIDLDSGHETTQQFYDLRPAQVEQTADDELAHLLRSRLSAAVERHLVTDVPMGIFLSGGLDSSAITTFANRHSRKPLPTFSMGFSASDRGDEIGYAAKVAETLGSANVRFSLAPFALRSLGAIVSSLEEPLSDSAALPLWHLCKGSSAYVKVALSGEGGDETLGGYARYFWAGIADRLSHTAGWSHLVGEITDRLPTRTLGLLNVVRRAGKLAHSVNLPQSLRYVSWFEIFTPAEQRALCGAEATEPAARTESLFQRARDLTLDPVQTVQYVDFHTMLLDNLLMKADKLSMAHSLEVRVPFLDRRLVELGLALPARAKAGLRRNKALLREVLRSELPAAITNRPKRGFELPVDAWFREPSSQDFRTRILSGGLVKTLGLSPRAVASVVDRHLAGEDLGRKLFALTTLELWVEKFC